MKRRTKAWLHRDSLFLPSSKELRVVYVFLLNYFILTTTLMGLTIPTSPSKIPRWMEIGSWGSPFVPQHSNCSIPASPPPRESIYQRLSQTSPDNTNKNINQYSIDPTTRYPNINLQAIKASQVTLPYYWLFGGGNGGCRNSCSSFFHISLFISLPMRSLDLPTYTLLESWHHVS